ncbi:MAG: proline--tRNA ligase [Mobiluncus sp.]|uniref:proline--tRNA ligase n=1 Tax=Mobiluncus sp. TaxID=47293 RepID=UPI00258DE041|nr:proline--tRNA ligase [Mobiluncus sp.]MCI6584499.1 proline--tRNA ligase [Mobiluncus sp.]
MLNKMSSYFVRTLREDPVEAEVDSHKLLVRAGYIRRAAPGIYTWLPLGLKVLRNIENIVREEMDRIGGQELQFPLLLPREPYEATNRWEEFGPSLFKLKDRKEGDYLLAPTHEEMFTLIVKDLYSSYKDLPVLLYQIKEKYRDEARPRAGIIRGREFVMKDLYSFDLTDEGLAHSYQLNRGAYRRVYTRLGLDFVICQAMSGAMGGSASEEFLFPCEIGEDTFVKSPGGYAANAEAVTTPVPDAIPFDDAPEAKVLPTPDSTTIETLVAQANKLYPREDRPWEATDTLKNVVVVAQQPDGSSEVLVVGVPGNREVDMKRLEAALAPAEVRMAEPEDLKAYPDLVPGYIGPQVIGPNSPRRTVDEEGHIAGSPRYLLDPRVVSGTRWITGANEEGMHVFNLVAGRDFEADGTVEAAEVLPGDPAPDGSGPLTLERGIEIGHIFALGRKYAKALGLTVLDENGKAQVVTMGSYGIGVSRLVAAVAENSHDDKGLIWPVNVAPFQVHVLATGKDSEVFEVAEKLARELEDAGVSVLYDDRPKASAGVKFKDAELMGMPYLLVVGKGLSEGKVEIRDRKAGTAEDVAPDAVVTALVERIKGELEKTALARTSTELVGEPDQWELDQGEEGME